MWGLLSFVFFCLPIFNVLSFLAFKRRASVRRVRRGAFADARDGGALVLSRSLGSCASGCWIWLVTDIRADNARVDARKTELSKQIAAHPEGPTLDHPFACALAELHVLTNGYDGSTNTGSSATWTARVRDRAERSRRNARFQVSRFVERGQKSATICFKLGARWFVQEARATGCELK
jgi:hypothetical protein